MEASLLRKKMPGYSGILTDDEIGAIKRSAYEILLKTGCRIDHPEGVQLLKQAGCSIKDHLVKIPQHIIEHCISNAPKGFTIYDRDGRRAMELEDQKSYYGNSPAAPQTMDAATDEIRKTRLVDIERGAKIADSLSNIDFVMAMGSSQDVDPLLAQEVHEFETVVNNTAKPIMFVSYSTKAFEFIYEMAAEVAGGMDTLRERPFIIAFPEPITPMVYPHDTVERVLFAANLQMPQYCGPIASLGVSGPVTLAGCLALVLAEALVGLILAQLKKPGAPCVLCAGVIPFDMATSFYSGAGPEVSLARMAFSQIAGSYGFPTFGVAGLADSHTIDAQAGAEGMFSLLLHRLSGINLIHGLGYTSGSMTASPKQLVLCDEMIGMVERIMQGIEVNADTLSRDLVQKVGPGGNFLQEEHTLRHFRNELWMASSIFSKMELSAWQTEGAKDTSQRLGEKIAEILDTHKAPSLPDKTINALAKIKAAADKALGNS